MKPECSKILKAEARVDFHRWAESLLQEIYYAPNDEQRESIIAEHLLKAVKRGYVDGTDFGWVHDQEANPQEQECEHAFDEMNPFREPSQMVCKKCGEWK